MVTRTKKIFVGGLSATTTLEDVKNYFEQFGRVSWFIELGFFISFVVVITIKKAFLLPNSVVTTTSTSLLPNEGEIIAFPFQIEDAMLMFDKQTNRHRYHHSFSLYCHLSPH